MKLTQSDILRKQQKIAEYQERLAELRREGVDKSDKEDIGFEYHPSQVLYNEQRELLLRLIRKEEDDILNAEIVSEISLDENLVSLGDTITLLMQFEGEEPYESQVLLTDMETPGINIVTTSSPIGKAIYGKEVGSVVNCKTPHAPLTVTILEKSQGLKR